jgi:hypothetical protein
MTMSSIHNQNKITFERFKQSLTLPQDKYQRVNLDHLFLTG